MTVTYETLFEILRKEKNHEDLQKLADSFFVDVQKYVSEKSLQLGKPRLDEFTEAHENQQNAIRIQLQNIKKLIRDIFDRRERKIIEMALNKAKTGSNIVDTGALLPEEHAFFQRQLQAISLFRSDILEPTVSAQKPLGVAPEAFVEAQKPKDLNMEPSESNTKVFKRIQILETIPKFVGVDLEIYGPFNVDETHELKPEIAEMLVKTNKAEEVQ